MITDTFTHITNAAVTESVLLWTQCGLIGDNVLLEKYRRYPASWLWELVLTFAMFLHCFQWTVLCINLVHHVSRLLGTCQVVRGVYTGQTFCSFCHERSFFTSYSELVRRLDEDMVIDWFWPFLRWLDFVFNHLFNVTLHTADFIKRSHAKCKDSKTFSS